MANILHTLQHNSLISSKYCWETCHNHFISLGFGDRFHLSWSIRFTQFFWLIDPYGNRSNYHRHPDSIYDDSWPSRNGRILNPALPTKSRKRSQQSFIRHLQLIFRLWLSHCANIWSTNLRSCWIPNDLRYRRHSVHFLCHHLFHISRGMECLQEYI